MTSGDASRIPEGPSSWVTRRVWHSLGTRRTTGTHRGRQFQFDRSSSGPSADDHPMSAIHLEVRNPADGARIAIRAKGRVGSRVPIGEPFWDDLSVHRITFPAGRRRRLRVYLEVEVASHLMIPILDRMTAIAESLEAGQPPQL